MKTENKLIRMGKLLKRGRNIVKKNQYNNVATNLKKEPESFLLKRSQNFQKVSVTDLGPSKLTTVSTAMYF